jgi:hypothetical protein
MGYTPDPVQQLLPPISIISLQHLPVLDLHYYALAKQAVNLILSSTAFTTTSSSTWKSNAAYFFVSTKEVAGQLSGVSVYAVGGGNLKEPNWARTNLQQGSAACNIDAGCDLSAVLLGQQDRSVPAAAAAAVAQPVAPLLQRPEGLPFWDVARGDCSNGSVMVKGISRNHKCFGRQLQSLLIEAVSGIGSGSSTEAVKVSSGCVEYRAAAYVYEVGEANLWVVH